VLFRRNIEVSLESWKENPNRKPLVVMGARQVGKTTLIQSFGENNYYDVAYYNFELNQELHDFFELNKDPERIIESLTLFRGKAIDIAKTLIIFDEIQECPKALTALKYFQEAETKYHLIAAGSLLGITLGQSRSFPVGKVEFLDLNPLTFEEFLLNTNDKLYKTYVHYLHEKTLSKIPNAFFEPLLNEFKTYLICGGMPEPASIFSDTKDIGKLQKVQDEILRSYQLDFSKHTSPINANRIQYVWNSITSQLSKENKKFIYKAVKKGARAREYEAAITWLQQAGIIHQIYNVSNPLLPLSAYRDLSAFKMYLLDVGLLMRMSKLNPSTLINGNDLFKEFKGSFAENYAAQSLLNALYSEASYWTSDRTAEVDFLIEHENQIIPIEVKSGKATRSRSLAEYNKKYKPQVRVRLSPLNIQTDGAFINIPIFYCDNIIEFINKM
jgi:predicted AAA+ superfamily ATPase